MYASNGSLTDGCSLFLDSVANQLIVAVERAMTVSMWMPRSLDCSIERGSPGTVIVCGVVPARHPASVHRAGDLFAFWYV